MSNIDISLCIIPKVLPDAPTIGVSLLKSYVQEAGFTCKVFDFNVLLFRELKSNNEGNFYYEGDSIFLPDWSKHYSVMPDEFKSLYEKYSYVFLEWIDLLKEANSEYIGLSVFSDYSLPVAIKLSYLIREHIPKAKIIWGGPYIQNDWCNILIEDKVIDFYIKGDAEVSLVKLLQGEFEYPGINGSEPIQMTDLDSLLVPDYDDINWDMYNHNPRKTVYITGSRGCVKKCTFCDVANIWPKYTYRSGEKVVNEIKILRQKYGRKYFKFTDSLINGGMKILDKILSSLIEYRNDGNEDVKWASQWIMRSKLQMPEDSFKKLKESGCDLLEIGMESFSQDVRYHMGKRFSDIDMWWGLDMLQKYKIRHVLLMIVGYPTETEADHQKTIDTIYELHRRGYLHSTVNGERVLLLAFNHTMKIWDYVPLWDMIKDDITNYQSGAVWNYKDNTFEVRLKRIKEIQQLIKELNGLDSFDSKHNQRSLENIEREGRHKEG